MNSLCARYTLKQIIVRHSFPFVIILAAGEVGTNFFPTQSSTEQAQWRAFLSVHLSPSSDLNRVITSSASSDALWQSGCSRGQWCCTSNVTVAVPRLWYGRASSAPSSLVCETHSTGVFLHTQSLSWRQQSLGAWFSWVTRSFQWSVIPMTGSSKRESTADQCPPPPPSHPPRRIYNRSTTEPN